MAKINENFLKLKAGYLFPEIARRVNSYIQENPEASVLKLGIGDVTEPLTPALVNAFKKGVEEMSDVNSFHGYGPEQGYLFLRDLISANDFNSRDIKIESDEIFISDGSKCDTGNIQEIFSTDAVIAVTDPVYPVYVDTNVMAGRTGEALENGFYDKLVYLPSTADNSFSPPLPDVKADIIYLCSPNNPTGTVLNHSQLKAWVDYALKNKSIILFDAAYESFISDASLPHSIFEIEGAKKCAIEFRSFSKNAGFTGVRCAYTVVPKELKGYTKEGEEVSIHSLWNRRHCTKFNGVSYPVQCAAAAVYSEDGKKEVSDRIAYYMNNASLLLDTLKSAGIKTFGGVNAPYIWFMTPGEQKSWDYFDFLLKEVNIVGTPGSGFGPAGEGYFRLSAFGKLSTIEEACERLKKKL